VIDWDPLRVFDLVVEDHTGLIVMVECPVLLVALVFESFQWWVGRT